MGSRAFLDPVANHGISVQPGLGGAQHFPLLGPGAGNIAARLDRRPRLAIGCEYRRAGLVHLWWAGALIEASEDLHADVRQKTQLRGDYAEPQARIEYGTQVEAALPFVC